MKVFLTLWARRTLKTAIGVLFALYGCAALIELFTDAHVELARYFINIPIGSSIIGAIFAFLYTAVTYWGSGERKDALEYKKVEEEILEELSNQVKE